MLKPNLFLVGYYGLCPPPLLVTYKCLTNHSQFTLFSFSTTAQEIGTIMLSPSLPTEACRCPLISHFKNAPSNPIIGLHDFIQNSL